MTKTLKVASAIPVVDDVTGGDDLESSSGDSVLDRALKRSLENVKQVKESTPERFRIRERRIQKKLEEISKLETRDEDSLTTAERKKIERKEELESKLIDVQNAIDTSKDQEDALERVCKVRFDPKFACPVCSEVMEAAVKVLPCKHVFCRACIEKTLDNAVRNHRDNTSGLILKCPICRTNLYDRSSKRVHTRPAKKFRKRLGKVTGTCHCGREMPLSSLRSHLRECGSKAVRALYGEKPRFGNGRFKQPDIEKIRQSQSKYRRASADYDEEAALQAALVESLRTAGMISGKAASCGSSHS
eukprot:g5269.t1